MERIRTVMDRLSMVGCRRHGLRRELGRYTCGSLIFALLIALPNGVAGEIYKYVDRDGKLHLTNVPTTSKFNKIDFAGPVLKSRLSTYELDQAIARYASIHSLDPALVRAVIKAESNFDPNARSKAGAMGLMQLMPTTALSVDVHDPYNPIENIRGGSRYLRHLLDRFHGRLPLALAAYNAGASKVERYQTIPPIKETRQYVHKVLGFYKTFLSLSSNPHRPASR